MVFSDTTTKLGLIQDCEDLTGLGNAAISGSTDLLARFTKYINRWYNTAVVWMLEAADKWEWDDPNKTDFPIGTANLVNNQQDYTLPVASSGANASTLLKIVRVEVKDSNGVFFKLDRIDETQIARYGLADFYKTAGMPKLYREVANSIELYPKPDTTVVTATAGLKVYFQRTPTLFAATDTTLQPGIPEPFHSLLSLGASYDFAKGHGLSNAAILKQDLADMRADFQAFIASRNKNEKLKFVARRESYL